MKKRSKKDMRAAVRRGIALLDNKLPMWRRFFRLKEFDFRDPCRCIVGTIGASQINCPESSAWYRGKRALNLSPETHLPEYFGFDWSTQYPSASQIPYLSNLWHKAIKGEKV